MSKWISVKDRLPETNNDFPLQVQGGLAGIMTDIVRHCHWNDDLVCHTDRLCDDCEHQPDDDDKKNGKNEPIPIKWEYDGYGSYPMCPSCNDMPYSYDRCVWCGQKFIKDEEAERRSKPPKVEYMDCFNCGGKNTVQYTRSYYNGHKNGQCTACGVRFIE